MLMRRLASPSATGPPKTDATTYGNQFRSGHIHPQQPPPPPPPPQPILLLPIIEEIERNGTPDDDGLDSPVVTPGKRTTGGLDSGKTDSHRTFPTATSIESSLLAASPSYNGNPTDFSSERSRDGVAGDSQQHRKWENSRFLGPCCRTCRTKHSPRVVARREPDKLQRRSRRVTLYRREGTFDRFWSNQEPIPPRAIDDAGAILDPSRLDCPPDTIAPALVGTAEESGSLASATNLKSHSRGLSAEQPILGENESTRGVYSLVGITRGIVHRQSDTDGSDNHEPAHEMVSRASKSPEPVDVRSGKRHRESSSSSSSSSSSRDNLVNEDHGQNQDQNQVQTPSRWDGEAFASRTTSLDRPIVVVGDDPARASANKSRKKSGKRSRSRWSDERYGLVFVLHLLALPILLCATNASLPVAAALAFPQNAPLAHAQNNNNAANRNGSTVLQGSKEQRYDENEEEKNTTRGHPYTEYAWEVNQINPWLSACDLAGPAPADLQGSCGPPETPKNCPPPCEIPRETTSKRDSDLFFAVVSQAAEYAGSRWKFVTTGRSKTTTTTTTTTTRATTTTTTTTTTMTTRSRSETGERVAPEQCLFYLEESHKREICRDGFGENSSHKFSTVQENRYRFLSGLRLRHCCEHAALNALAPGKGGPLEEVLAGGTRCTVALDKLLAVDALAARLHCEFGEVLARYDCGQQYSVIYNCSHCKEAYRRWVCSSLVPYFAHDDQSRRTKNEREGLPVANEMRIGMRIRSCRSFCQTVEQRCPYLLPGDRAPAYPTQYAGEPTFLCRDPNIPETGQQAARALHADDDCCFHVCSDNDPGLGVCTNCTKPEVEIAIRGGSRDHDPSSAPQCEMNPSIPQGSTTTGNHEPATTTSGSEIRVTTEADMNSKGERGSTSSSPPASTTPGSFCGSGGVGSMTSGASPRTGAASIPPLILCAFCAWGVLVSTCTIRMTSPFRVARATVNSSRVTMTKCIKCSLTVIENWSSENRARIVPGSTIKCERVVEHGIYSPLSRMNFRLPGLRLRKIGSKPRLSEKIT